MEDRSFPPAYDEGYRPPSDSRYWFPTRETMHPSDREKAILARLQEVCAYAYGSSPFYRRKWDAAGFHPSMLKSLEDFESARAGGHEGRTESRPGRRPALRRLPVRSGERDLPRSRHQRHYRPADRFCDRPHRLARRCQRPCPHHVGDGRAPRRHRLRRGDLQPLCGQLGRAGRSGAPRVESLSLRRRRLGHERALRAVARYSPALRLLRHSDLRAASCPDRVGQRSRS